MKIPPLLALVLGLLSFIWFSVHVVLSSRGFPVSLLWFAAIPPVLFSGVATFRGILALRDPGAAPKGIAIGSTFTGGLGLLFWLVLVPLISVFALPALQEDDVPSPLRHESQQQMRILIRGVKTFHRLHDRAPVKIEELVDQGMVPHYILYDPRDPLKDVPSYRIVSNLPANPALWATTPALEGRWPDANGKRLMGYWDESIRDLDSQGAP